MEHFNNVYKGKTVLITGHTGFKGSWLSIWLRELGARVVGYALEPHTDKDNFMVCKLEDRVVDIRGDIRDYKQLKEVFDIYEPDFVFHLAAQPLVRNSYDIPIDTYEVNVMGTINVLECIRHCSHTKVGIFITTDKCYDNKEQYWGYKEDDALGGFDPYSSSKACAEIAIASWKNAFINMKDYDIHGKAIASARAGNVIGGGDWAKDRIIPDCIRAIEYDKPICIRNPHAVRPWQHVLEPLYGYLLLAEKITEDPNKYSQAWNFGPHIESIVPVWEVATELVKCYGQGELRDVSSMEKVHEANLLNLDISKTYFELGWHPRWTYKQAISYTTDWYKKYRYKNTHDLYDLCVKQINEYMLNVNS